MGIDHSDCSTPPPSHILSPLIKYLNLILISGLSKQSTPSPTSIHLVSITSGVTMPNGILCCFHADWSSPFEVLYRIIVIR